MEKTNGIKMFEELETLSRSTDNLDYLKGMNDTIRIIRKYVTINK